MNPGKGIYLRGATYWLKFQRNGVRRYVTLETSNPTEAVARAFQIRNAPAFAAKSALAGDVERYIADKRRLNTFGKGSERLNRAVLKEFTDKIGLLSARDLTTAQVEQHYRLLQKRVAETTAQIHMRAIHAFLAWCVDEHLCMENVASKVKLTKIDKPARQRFCRKDQRDLLIKDAPDDDLRFILYAGFHTGMRKNEIIEARVCWFQLHDRGACHIQATSTFRPKDREARHIPITKAFRRFLRKYLKGKKPDDFALRPTVSHGRGIYRYDFHRPWNDYVTAKGMRWVTAHVMRHTFASLLVQCGVNVFKVSKWLGDGVEVVEKHYAHLAPQDDDIEKMI